MKFCKDCVHYKFQFAGLYNRCMSPHNKDIDPVTGNSYYKSPSAVVQRYSRGENYCGPEGKWWIGIADHVPESTPVKKPWYKFWS